MKISTKFRKICAAVMAALIINTSVFSVYTIQAQAYAGYGLSLFEALLGLWGFGNGFGSSGSGLSSDSSADILQRLLDNWNAGESLELDGGYSVRSLVDGPDYFDFLSASYEMLSLYHNTGMDNLVYDAMNQKSYKATGTVATKSMSEELLAAMVLYQDDPEAFQEKLDSFYAYASGQSVTPNMSYEDMTTIFNALMSAISVNSVPDINSDWFKPIDNSVYSDDYANILFDVNGVSVKAVKGSYYTFSFANGQIYNYFSTRSCVGIFYSSGGTFFATGPFQLKVEYILDSSTVVPVTLNSSYYNGSADGKPLYFISVGFSNEIISSNVLSAFCDIDSRYVNNYAYANYDYLFDSSVGTIHANFPAMTPDVASKMAKFMRTASFDSIWDLYQRVLLLNTAGTDTAVDDLIDAIDTPGTIPDAGTTETTGLLESILDALASIPASIGSVFESPLLGLKEAIDVIPASLADLFDLVTTFPPILLSLTDLIGTFPDIITELGSDILTIPDTITLDLGTTLEDIREDTAAIADAVAGQPEENNGHSNDYLTLLSGLFILIKIILELLQIFVHCLGFIIAIFRIRANTAFIPEDMLLGLNYIKTLVIPGLELSVYDFMMGLVYIMIIFFVIKVLRVNIDRIRLPRD